MSDIDRELVKLAAVEAYLSSAASALQLAKQQFGYRGPLYDEIVGVETALAGTVVHLHRVRTTLLNEERGLAERSAG